MNHIIQKSLFCSKYISEDILLEWIINCLKDIKHFNSPDFKNISTILSPKKKLSIVKVILPWKI